MLQMTSTTSTGYTCWGKSWIIIGNMLHVANHLLYFHRLHLLMEIMNYSWQLGPCCRCFPYSGWQLAPKNGLVWKWIWPPNLFTIVESGVWDILKRINPSLMALRLSVNCNQVASVYKLTKNESFIFFLLNSFCLALISQQILVAMYHSLVSHYK